MKLYYNALLNLLKTQADALDRVGRNASARFGTERHEGFAKLIRIKDIIAVF